MNRRQHVGAAAVRGVVGAMAMTAMRRVTTRLGMLEEPPPDAATKHPALPLAELVPLDAGATTELVHWSFGAAAGAVYGFLPDRLTRNVWAGPVYGLAVWVGFEMTLAPVLGFPHARRRRIAGRLAVAADHALYGAIVGARTR